MKSLIKIRRVSALLYSDVKEVKLVDLDSGWERWKKPKLEINGVFNLDINIVATRDNDVGEQLVTFYLDKSHIEKLKEILPIVQRKT